MTPRRLLSAVAAAGLALLALPSAASAAVNVSGAFAQPGTVNSSYTLAPGTKVAGGHPPFTIALPNISMTGNDDLRDVNIRFPRGWVGNPQATTNSAGDVTVCTWAQFNTNNGSQGNRFTSCPAASAVGTVNIRASAAIFNTTQTGTLFNLEANPGTDSPARLGLFVQPQSVFLCSPNPMRFDVPVWLRADDDYTFEATLRDIPRSISGSGLLCIFGSITIQQISLTMNALGPTGGNPTRPYMTTNPSDCSEPARTRVRVRGYGTNAPWQDVQQASGPSFPDGGLSFGPTNCEEQPFSPGLETNFAKRRTGTVTGAGIAVTQPDDEANGLNPPRSRSQMKQLTVDLPEGTTFNPGVAKDLALCSDADFGQGSPEKATCPFASQIGELEFVTPILGEPLSGEVYLGTPTAEERWRLFVNVRVPGIEAKLVARLRLDSETGQISAHFDELPPLPWSRFELTFYDNVLATNEDCSQENTSVATATPFSLSPAAPFTASYETWWDGVDEPCPTPLPFDPTVDVGLGNTDAGHPTTMDIKVTRGDRERQIDTLRVRLPAGMMGRIDQVQRCSESTLAAIEDNVPGAACSNASRVGNVDAVVGPGEDPVSLDGGEVFLTDGRFGDPAGLAIVVRAQVGPIDLGNVLIRARLGLRSTDYGIDVVTDPIPQFVEGVKLGLREMDLQLNRPGFLVNPPSCGPKTFVASVASVGDAAAGRQPVDLEQTIAIPTASCDEVPFNPAVTTEVSATTPNTPVAASATLTMDDAPASVSEAHVQNVELRLPHALALNAALADGLEPCTPEQFGLGSEDAASCPGGSTVGEARLETAVIGTLTGDVYFGTPTAQTPFPIYVELAGGGQRVKLAGNVRPAEGTGFVTAEIRDLPQFPFSSFTLSMTGAANPVLVTGPDCGSYAGTATIEPWSGGDAAEVPAGGLQIQGDPDHACSSGKFDPAMAVELSTLQAGDDPELSAEITRSDDDRRLSTLHLKMPPGLAGYVQNVPLCTLAQAGAEPLGCIAESQIGTLAAEVGVAGSHTNLDGRVYLTEPRQGGDPGGLLIVIPAQIGPVDLGEVRVPARLTVRPTDFGIDVITDPLPNMLRGIPISLRKLDLAVTRRNFLTNPTNCEPKTFSAVLGPEGGGDPAEASDSFTPTGCGDLDFSGELDASLSTYEVDSPTGATIEVAMPFAGYDELPQAHVRTVTIDMPEGLALNAGLANGLTACTEQQFGAGHSEPAECPAGSRVGTAEIDTPLIGALDGAVYFGEPSPEEPYPIYVEVSQDGLNVKLRGQVAVGTDPNDDELPAGRVRAVFDELPPVSFTRFSLALNGGPNAVLVTQPACDSYSLGAVMTPWRDPDEHLSVSSPEFTLSDDEGDCRPPAFDPTVDISVDDPRAGRSPGMTFTVTRPDRQRRLSRVRVALPPGFAGRVADHPHKCSGADIDAIRAGQLDACSDARIGSILATAGIGPSPVPLQGDVFLAEGQGDDPAALAIVLPGKVGPIDVGPIVVMARLAVRSRDFSIDVVTDPLPVMQAGIPIPIQRLELQLDGDGFLINPTSCEEATFTTSLTPLGSGDGVVMRTSSFTPTECDQLEFDPSITAGLEPGKADAPAAPSFGVTLPVGSSAVRDATIAFPVGVALNPAGAQGLSACSPNEFGIDNEYPAECPSSSKVGTADATSPLIGGLSGDVFFGTQEAPSAYSIYLELAGGGVRAKVAGRAIVDSDTGQVRTVFEDLPQTPLSALSVQFQGGPRALMRSPIECGTHTTTATLEPWLDSTTPDGAPLRTATRTASFEVSADGQGAPCGEPGFAPSLSTSLSTTEASASPALTMTVDRPDGDRRLDSASFRLPAGLTGRLTGVTPCAAADAAAVSCPTSSRIGAVDVAVGVGPDPATITGDIFLTEPRDADIAALSIELPSAIGPVDLGRIAVGARMVLHTTDLSLEVITDPLPRMVEGVPLDLRTLSLRIDRPDLLRNPATCETRQFEARLTDTSGQTVTRTDDFTPTGCEGIVFEPEVEVEIGRPLAERTSGLAIDVRMPQSTDTAVQADIRRIAITLPDGMTVNPGMADGLARCSDAAFGPGAQDAAACPAGSQLGTAQVISPLIGALDGSVYLGEAKPGNLFPLLLEVARSGVRFKLTGATHLDPATGLIETVFDDLPQTPLSRLLVNFAGGERSLVVTPSCGDAATTTRLTPWGGGPAVIRTTTTTITGDSSGGPCSTAFTPTLETLVDPPQAGGSPRLVSVVHRPDRQQRLQSLTLRMPAGLLGRLGSVTPCSDDAAASASCPVDSRIGSLSVIAGPGTSTITLGGTAYLTEGTGSDVAGLALVVPATVGPVNLGDIVLRPRMALSPQGQLSVRTGDLPAFFKGIPLSFRSLRLTFDRPGFLRAPTGCEPRPFTGTAEGAQGAEAELSSPFQAVGCSSLTFAPRISGSVGEAGKTGTDSRPPLGIALTVPQGHAALREARFALLSAIGPDISALGRVCATPQDTASCPEASRVGKATATSPLLRAPVHASVVLADSEEVGLPRLAMTFQELGSMRIFANLALENGRIVARLENLPDIPLTAFELQLEGGNRGVVVARQDLCRADTDLSLTADLVSQGSQFASSLGRFARPSCAARRRPAKLRSSYRIRPRKKLTAHDLRFAPSAGWRIAKATVTLPPALAQRAGTRAKVSVGANPIRGAAVWQGRRSIKLVIPKPGVARLRLRWTGSPPPSAKKRRRVRLRLRATLESQGEVRTVAIPVHVRLPRG